MSPTLYQADLRITNHRGQKSPPLLTLLSFKTRIKWPLGWPQPQVFRGYFFNSCNFQDNVQAFRLTWLLRWQKLTWFFQHFLQDLLISQFNSAFAASFHSTWSDATVRFDSGAIFLDQSQFFATHSNQWNCFILHCTDRRSRKITSNGFFPAKAGQKAGSHVMLKYFETKKAFRYYRKQIDSMLPCVWFSNRSQKTSKCGKNISDTLGYASCATFLFLPHFDVICDLLLNRRTATWNLFVK